MICDLLTHMIYYCNLIIFYYYNHIAEALKSGKPVVVDFAADWCPDCQQIAPVLLELKQQVGKDIEFVTMDVSYAAPGLSKKWWVSELPPPILTMSSTLFKLFWSKMFGHKICIYNISTDENHWCWNARAFKRPWVGSTLPRNLQNDFWARKLGVDGLPHVAFIDSQRHVQTALVGDVPANVVRADVEALIKGAEMPFIMYDAFEGQSNKIEWITLTTRWWPNRSHLFGIIWRGLKRLKILMSATPVVYFEPDRTTSSYRSCFARGTRS